MVFQVAQFENKKRKLLTYTLIFYLKIDILLTSCPVLSGFATNAL